MEDASQALRRSTQHLGTWQEAKSTSPHRSLHCVNCSLPVVSFREGCNKEAHTCLTPMGGSKSVSS
eukprot:4723739-Amphidinium_carterae.1